ncbi:MAG TPA: tRNA (adenosine(37)-N6)-threonylcarbamoyltransferase complex dimerization subunit type 1 TsaB [Terriglobales bacterium]|nr:tRNA (adenosine(37)-N6)-threonylcarbamoyltransferase complex dimerization subunit type 1 TsaB [Terriglobales bacterium]
MLLLAVDTSGKFGGIALARCDDDTCDVVETVPLVGGTFSAQLVPQIAELLSKHGSAKRDIGAFAVATGPGSFTGLRVGLAAIQALAEVLGKPIAGISLLEAIASASSVTGRVLALMDAGRQEVFAGTYEIVPKSRDVRAIDERLARIDELEPAKGEHIVTPDQNVSDFLLRKGVKAEVIHRPGTDSLAHLGWRKILAGDTVPPEQLEANYIRQSDAEIFSKTQGLS